MVDEWNRDALLAPIGEQQTGEDLSFSLVVDEIREARRADPVYLNQGEWQSDLKRADWNAVIALSAKALAEQSKDVMIAGWLCEGLSHRDAFRGMAFGLGVISALCETYWERLYPQLDDGEEERLGRFTWLDDTLAAMVGSIPLLEGEAGYGLDRYEESRQVENLARNDAEAMGEALSDGKINAEIFQRAVTLTSPEQLLERHGQLKDCRSALASLEAVLVTHLGDQAPPFSRLTAVLESCARLLERLLMEKGVDLEAGKAAPEELADVDAVAADPVSTAPTVTRPSSVLRTTPQNREEAFAMLGAVAQYFKTAEPQSPVPYLVERAVRWGRMPLEEWLRDVIREDNVIDSIRETLGTQGRDAGESQ